MKILYAIVLLCTISLLTNKVYAQRYEIKTVKEKYFGDTLWLKKDSICLSKEGIVKCIASNEVIKLYNSKYDYYNLQLSQQYYNTYGNVNHTAFMQPKGSFLIRNFFIFDNSVSYGVTNYLNIHLGNTIISANNLDSPYTPFFAVKAATPIWKNKINLGGRISYQRSTMYDTHFGRDEYLTNNWIFSYSSFLTLGNPDNNLNLSYSLENYKYKDNVKILSIGAKCRITYKTSTLMETYIINGKLKAFTLGLRSDFKNASISFGFVAGAGENFIGLEEIPLPYFGIILAL